MKRHVIALTLGIVLLLVSSLAISCVKKTAEDSGPTDGIAYQSDIVRLDTAIGKKADQSAVDAILKLVPAGGTSSNSYSKTETYTKAEADAMANQKVADAIAALKNDQSWIKGNTAAPAGETGEYGTLVSSDGKLELWIDKVSPASDFYTEAGANNDVAYFGRVTVVNKDTARHSYDLSLFITPDSPCTILATTDNLTRLTVNSEELSFITAKIIPPAGYLIREDSEFEFRTAVHGSIKADSFRKYAVSLDICQLVPTGYEVYWEWNWEISDRS